MNKNNFTIVSTKKQSFFSLSEKYNDVAPLRRILSLLRMEGKCRYIVISNMTLTQKNDFKCGKFSAEDRRCESCARYLKNIKIDGYEYDIIEKKCTKMYFFECHVDYNTFPNDEKYQKGFLGYCIIHSDKLKRSNGEKLQRFYVPDCVLLKLDNNITGYRYGNYSSEITINKVKFKFKNGIYFSQQNGITNFCAHAAIKTALRSYNDDFSCDNINKSLFRSCVADGTDISTKIFEMRKGLSPEEIINSIVDISKNSNKLNLSPYTIKADDRSLPNFLEVIYRAVESKIPVILLLRIPDNLIATKSFIGHAVSLTGHTLNSHNWCIYGSGYFSDRGAHFISSQAWCDNFIIQDDNFGPAYQLPLNFIVDYFSHGMNLERLERTIASHKKLFQNESDFPISAIIIPPSNLIKLVENIETAEQVAITIFTQQIINFEKAGKFNLLNKRNRILFDRFFYYIFSQKKNNIRNLKPKVFIARTILTSKKEYLKSSVKPLYDAEELEFGNNLAEIIDEWLPDYFWMTEISVPELYWVNEGKVGEIIIDFNKTFDGIPAVRLIRLPFLISIYPPDLDDKYSTSSYTHLLTNQKKPYQRVLVKSLGLIRLIEQELSGLDKNKPFLTIKDECNIDYIY